MFTIQQLKNIHTVFNQQVFDGELSEVPFGVKRSNNTYGSFECGTNIKHPRMFISRETLEEGTTQILATIAHEMCHQAQLELSEAPFKVISKEMDHHNGFFPVYVQKFKDRFPRHNFIDHIV